jgi:hypothetical protein
MNVPFGSETGQTVGQRSALRARNRTVGEVVGWMVGGFFTRVEPVARGRGDASTFEQECEGACHGFSP